MNRRLTTLAVVAILFIPRLGAGAEVDPTVEVRWRLPPDLQTQAEKVIRPGLQLKGKGQGERVAPLLVVAGVVSLAYIVRSAIEIYRDVKYGGIVLSVKAGTLQISNDPRLPAGIVVVRNADNIQVLSTSRQNEGEILTKLAPLLSSK